MSTHPAPNPDAPSTAPDAEAGARSRREAALRRARSMAHFLDTAYTLPGTNIRFGYDAIIGLLPVVGDTATLVLGAVPLVEGARLGVRKRALAMMVWRLIIDWFVGLVPLVDIVLDVAYKANKRNAEHLARELERGVARGARP